MNPIVFAVALGVIAVFVIAIWRNCRKLLQKVVVQLQIIICIFLTVLLSAWLSPLPVKRTGWLILDLAFLLGISIVTLLTCSRKSKDISLASRLLAWIRKDGWQPILLVVLTVATRYWMVGLTLSGDNAEYYGNLVRGCLTFNFSPASVLNYTLCSHMSYACGLFASIGVFLWPDGVEGVQVVDIAAMCVATVCLYCVLRRTSSGRKKNDPLPFFGAVLFLVNPLLWGMQEGFSADFWAVVFFCLLVYCDAFNFDVLVVFFALCLGFTKESYWFAMVGYALARGFYLLSKTEGDGWQRIRKAIGSRQMRPLLIACLVGALLIVALRTVGGTSWAQSDYFKGYFTQTAETAFNTFGFNADHVVTIFLQQFVANFSWLITIFTLCTLVYLRKRGPVSLPDSQAPESLSAGYPSDNAVLISLCGAGGAYLLISCLFITSCTPRYAALAITNLLLIAILLMKRLTTKQLRTLSLPCAAIIALNLVQAVYPLDPITNLCFRTKDVGGTKVLCLSQSSNGLPGRDYYTSNLQCGLEDKALEAMLRESNYSRNDSVVLVAGNTFQESNANGYLTEITGRLALSSKSDSDKTRMKSWNEDTKRFENEAGTNENVVRTLYSLSMFGWSEVTNPDALIPDQDTYARIYLESQTASKYIVYFDPIDGIDEGEEISTLSKFFNVGERHVADFMGYEIPYYVMTKKITIPGATDSSAYYSEPSVKVVGDALETPAGFEGTVLIDPTTATNGLSFTDEDAASAWLTRSGAKHQDPSDSTRMVVKPGDLVSCRIQLYYEGSWVRDTITPSGLILQQLTAGCNSYVGGIGEKLVGAILGQEFDVTTTLPDSYDSIIRGYGGKTVTLKIVPNAIMTELAEQKEYSGQVVAGRGLLEKRGVTKDAILASCVAASTYRPSDEEADRFTADVGRQCQKDASALGIESESYISSWLGLSDAGYENFRREYAVYLACRQHAMDAYDAAGVDIRKYK